MSYQPEALDQAEPYEPGRSPLELCREAFRKMEPFLDEEGLSFREKVDHIRKWRDQAVLSEQDEVFDSIEVYLGWEMFLREHVLNADTTTFSSADARQAFDEQMKLQLAYLSKQNADSEELPVPPKVDWDKDRFELSEEDQENLKELEAYSPHYADLIAKIEVGNLLMNARSIRRITDPEVRALLARKYDYVVAKRAEVVAFSDLERALKMTGLLLDESQKQRVISTFDKHVYNHSLQLLLAGDKQTAENWVRKNASSEPRIQAMLVELNAVYQYQEAKKKREF